MATKNSASIPKPDTHETKDEQNILLALRRIVRAVSLHSHTLAHAFGITVPQLLTLQEAARFERATPSTLGRETQISRSTMTGILKRLEERNLIARVADRKDRRKQHVEVTEKGKNLLKRCPSLLQETFRRKLSDLESWERTSLLSAVQRIASMMESDPLQVESVLSTKSTDVKAQNA